ncbi:EAL domain-containing protein [Deinococcus aluminii]|uniref:EAL domain-containing protein n=1 Tax=Deinococcus aluminii TaxID=1656885 RepID=UPI0031F1B49F
MTDGYVAVNREWQFTYINGVAQRMLPVPTTFLGQRVQDVLPEAIHFLAPCEQVMQTGEPATFEVEYAALQRQLRFKVYPTLEGIEIICQDLTNSWLARQDAACMLQLIETLNAARHLDQVIDAVLQHLHRQAYGVLLALHDPEHETLDVRYAISYDEAIIRPYLKVPVSARLPLPDTFRSGELRVLSREACQAQYPDMRLADQTRELVAVPLRTSGRTLGVLLLSLEQSDTIDVIARSRLSSLATHCAGAIERAQLYDEARRAEGRHRMLLETTHAIVWEVEGDFQSVQPMPTWEAFTGQPYAAYRGFGYLNAVHPDDQKRVQTEIMAGMAAARPFVMEGRLMTAAGVYREVVAHAVPVMDDRGGVQMWTGTMRDVTEERRQQRWQDSTRQLLLELSRAEDARAVYDITLAEVTRLVGPSRALLAGHTKGSNQLRVLGAQGVDARIIQHFRQFVLGSDTGLGARVAEGRPFWLHHALEEGRLPDLLAGNLIAGQGEILTVPLHHQGELTALLALSFPGGQRPAEEVLEQLAWLQPHLAQALQRAQLLYALERSEAQGQAILTALDEGVILVDVQGEVVSANPAACRLLALETEQFLQDTFDARWTVTDERGRRLPPEAYPAARVLKTGQTIKDEILHFIGREGQRIWFSVNATPLLEDGVLRGAVVSFIDVTEAYALRQQLEAQAHQDELTGLPNRRTFNRMLEELAADRHGAVLLLDLDRFKLVNDTYGHHVGDALLRVVAQRLTWHLDERVLVTWLAGDEYGLILPGVGAVEAEQIAQEIVTLLAQPVSINEIEFQVSACVGLCVSPQDGRTANDLYKHADLALHEAKRQGPGHWCAYTPDLAATYIRRVQVERYLRRALREGQLEVYYQPIVNLAQEEWTSFEALARWNDPVLGWVSPAEFVHVAEEAGLICELGTVVLQCALKQSVEWSRQSGFPVTVSVNVSATQLMRPEFPDLVARLLREADASAEQLTLEVTEAVVVQDVAFVTAQLHALRDLGVRVALDDFGTGFSSLSVLGRLPIDILKVDRAFVQGVHQEPRRQGLLSAVVLLGQRLGITVVAEGVEEQRELDVLQGLGCSHVQGYYFARPQPAQAFSPLTEGRLGR